MLVAVVDTNILIRLLTNDLPAQAAAARNLIANYKADEILLPEAVVAEIAFVLGSKNYYSASRSAVANILDTTLMIKQFACDRRLLSYAAKLYRATKFDFVDCLVLAAQKTGRVKTLLTFDKPLLKANQGK